MGTVVLRKYIALRVFYKTGYKPIETMKMNSKVILIIVDDEMIKEARLMIWVK